MDSFDLNIHYNNVKKTIYVLNFDAKFQKYKKKITTKKPFEVCTAVLRCE